MLLKSNLIQSDASDVKIGRVSDLVSSLHKKAY
jgi:hypothetical protein